MSTGVINGDVIYLREYETQNSTTLTLEHAKQIRAHFGKQLSVTPSWNEGWTLKAKQYVGTIALDGLRIVIMPKTTVENLFYMLTYAYDLPHFRDERITLGLADDLFEFIVSIFANQVEQLVRRGIYRNYLEREENQRFLRGKLMPGEQIRRNSVRVTHFYQQHSEFTADVLENQILKYTLWQLSHLSFRTPQLRQRLRRLMSAFVETSLRPVQPLECDRVVYTRLNAPYRSRIHLAQLLLRHLSLKSKEGDAPFVAFLFNMNAVFELFVARYLERYLTENHSAFTVEIQPQIWLGKESKEEGLPDIVLRYNGRRLMVLDTKYKAFANKPSPKDRNQMYMYCQSMGLTQGCLIYPENVAYQNTFPGVKLRGVGLSLDGELTAFRQSCQRFGQQFVEIMTPDKSETTETSASQ